MTNSDSGPFTGLLLADYGANILRLDRPHPSAHTAKPPPPTPDLLTRRKSSIAVNLKSPAGVELVKSLIPNVDVVIDPFRPGVLEKAGLSPEKLLLRLNPRLIIARMTGFRRDGKYRDMAGHDINYIAVSGVLSILGRAGQKPYAPANILGDFAGGGAMCFLGILLALLHRDRTGNGQVVEANMVDGSSYLASMPRLLIKNPMWDKPRGENVLDGGCPWYDTYETKDAGYMAVGALEPQFFAALLQGLQIDQSSLPGPRENRKTWPELSGLFTKTFKTKTRAEWESIFDGTDACCTPVMTQQELEGSGFDQRPPVTLKDSPGLGLTDMEAEGRPPSTGQGIGIDGEGWTSRGLSPGDGGEEVLAVWMGWVKGRHYGLADGGLVRIQPSTGKSRL
ncbi:hypothetical protein LTR66_013243 [Elasticomyces elasticus]|nr:hypothetical protein LTR66_013243 [Elasticomyces elasticus]KAK4991648.1 hypothetical protein LTR50_001656 [Elasticomyces elasticus]